MSKQVIAAAGVALLVLVGVLVYFVADDGGDDRKASIGAEGPKPDNPKAGPKSNDESPDKAQKGKSEPPGKAKALAAMQRKIERKAAKKGGGGDNTYASYVDTTTGEIVLVTDASETDVADITNLDDPTTRRRPRRRR